MLIYALAAARGVRPDNAAQVNHKRRENAVPSDAMPMPALAFFYAPGVDGLTSLQCGKNYVC